MAEDTLLYFIGFDGKDDGGRPYNPLEIEKLKKTWWPFRRFPRGDVVYNLSHYKPFEQILREEKEKILKGHNQ
ncbi:MAG: hypothetical protein ACTSVB_01550 [Candidatus Heimdallarchaeaceae archaeon]